MTNGNFQQKLKELPKWKKILRALIISLPWLIYVIRILITFIDVRFQSIAYKLLDSLNLIPFKELDPSLFDQENEHNQKM